MKKVNVCMDTEFYCVKCGNKGIPVFRKLGKKREGGHLKRLFCLNCQQEVNHAECREFTKYTKDDFQFEFDYRNFDEEGNRILPYGLFRDKMHREGVELYT